MNIRRGAEVRSADDAKLGKVIGVEGQTLVVEKGFLFPTDFYVPTSAIASTDGDTVYLTVSKDEAKASDWGQPPAAVTERRGPTTAATAAPSPTATAGTTPAGAEGDVLRVPVHEEELTATKRPVERGQVQIEKDVVAEEQTLEVPVTEERAQVTRRAVDREVPADATAFQEGTIEVPLKGEDVDVAKRVRVAEEVDVTKEAVQQTKRVKDTVRHEEVHVTDETPGASDTPQS
jgi:uncharacterized protein (TIGR02271 family)